MEIERNMASEWLREGDSKQERERERAVAEPESTTRFSWQSAVKTCGSCKSCKITCSRRSSCGPCPAPCFLVSLLPPPRYLTSPRNQLDKDKLLLALPAVKFASDRMCWLRLLNLKFCSWFYFVVGPEKGIDHIFNECVCVCACVCECALRLAADGNFVNAVALKCGKNKQQGRPNNTKNSQRQQVQQRQQQGRRTAA